LRGVRTGEVLSEGKNLSQGAWRHRDVSTADRSLGLEFDLIETLEFDNLIVQAVVTMDSAAKPHRGAAAPTRGRIFRPRRQELDETHAAWIDERGKTAIDYRPVHDYTMTERRAVHPAEGAGVLIRSEGCRHAEFAASEKIPGSPRQDNWPRPAGATETARVQGVSLDIRTTARIKRRHLLHRHRRMRTMVLDGLIWIKNHIDPT